MCWPCLLRTKLPHVLASNFDWNRSLYVILSSFKTKCTLGNRGFVWNLFFWGLLISPYWVRTWKGTSYDWPWSHWFDVWAGSWWGLRGLNHQLLATLDLCWFTLLNLLNTWETDRGWLVRVPFGFVWWTSIHRKLWRSLIEILSFSRWDDFKRDMISQFLLSSKTPLWLSLVLWSCQCIFPSSVKVYPHCTYITQYTLYQTRGFLKITPKSVVFPHATGMYFEVPMV